MPLYESVLNISSKYARIRNNPIGDIFVKSIKDVATADTLLKVVIIIAGAILASIVTVNLFSYQSIPYPWKIAISTFLLVVPISFFLQSKMTETSIMDERINEIKRKIQLVLSTNTQSIEKQKQRNLLSDETFLDASDKILDLIGDPILNIVYRRARQILLSYESEKRLSTLRKFNSPSGFEDEKFDNAFNLVQMTNQIESEITEKLSSLQTLRDSELRLTYKLRHIRQLFQDMSPDRRAHV